MTEKLNLVDRESCNITLIRQAKLLSISRSSLYYQSKISDRDLAIMNLIELMGYSLKIQPMANEPLPILSGATTKYRLANSIFEY